MKAQLHWTRLLNTLIIWLPLFDVILLQKVFSNSIPNQFYEKAKDEDEYAGEGQENSCQYPPIGPLDPVHKTQTCLIRRPAALH